ncbi:MAG: leucine-rich repeat domain-containing protein, partial [Muribaculum sp.]|nr:leucine-rich repeat domain-containing protein [Muribaculum sp.]
MFRNSLLIVLFGIITVYFHPLKASVTYSDSGSQTVENLVYQSVVSEGYAKVTGLASGNVTAIKIPETVTLEVQRTVTDTEGKTTTDYVSMKFPVREIASNAFSGKKTLASVLFNNNLVTIGSTAFANCIGLSGT